MDGGKNQGLGGVAARAELINKIRSEQSSTDSFEGFRSTDDNILLLDAGDIFQGTPYFNFFLGEVDVKLIERRTPDLVVTERHRTSRVVRPDDEVGLRAP